MEKKDIVIAEYPNAVCRPRRIPAMIPSPRYDPNCFEVIPNMNVPHVSFFGRTEQDAWDATAVWLSKKPIEGEITITDANMIEGYYNAREWQSDNEATVISVGDAVKLWLKDEYGTESIWVRVTEIDGIEMRGTLANDPCIMRFVQFGSLLKFKRTYIMEHNSYNTNPS